ncbi:alpha/beta hydrolase-fold protein [Roseivirga sp. 4D4]|uniref:alpha/beta hydrolase-fold protein n=1 Tax=Roseivirga sp. 4D4 TaxID=1889784 RepID=UPI001C882B8C|nr:alpha/beta hydrolase-fold protein [Roseivirga sp. 4D4]
MKTFFAIFLFLLSLCSIRGQESEVTIGKSVKIQSKVFDTERSLNVYLPSYYDESTKDYPVLYLLDGQNWFTYAVSINQLMTGYDYLPDFIIVGIETGDSPRYGFFANAEKLLNYIENDVIQHIDKNYRTNKDRMLLGWQFAGAFTIEAMIRKPDLFNAYFPASPIPLNDQRLEDFSKLLDNNPNLSQTLLFTTSLNENGVEPNVKRFATILEDKAPNSLDWEYKVMKSEVLPALGHRTTPMGTIYHGLRKHYADYPLLEFNTLEDFQQSGGHNYVNSYYRQRAEKYNLPEGIPQEGKFFLIRLGLDTDHFPTFDKFMSDFISTDFLDNVNLGWNTRYAEFYLKHSKPDGAKVIYERLIQRFPENARPVNGMGDAFRAEGNLSEARKYYIKAIELAEKNQDSRLETFKKDLRDISQ